MSLKNGASPGISARWRDVDVERIEGVAPSPEHILVEAEKTPAAPCYLSASSYGAAIKELRDKGYTWSEVTDWLRERGIDFSIQSVIGGWKTWERMQAREMTQAG